MAYRDLVLADGATHYWRLNEPSGTTAADLGAAPAAGTISGGVTLNQPGALADGDTAMTFNGTTGKIQTVASVTIPVIFSLECWLRFTTAGERILFSTRGIATGETFVCYIDPGTGVLQYFGAGGGFGTRTVRDGLWHHAVYTHDGATLRVYVDGAIDGTNTSPRTAASPGPVAIGWDQPNAEFWAELLDEVAIYPVALTPAQIATHYAVATTASGARRPIAWGVYTSQFATP